MAKLSLVLHVGESLQGGRYRIEALLGQGGMGGVYLATHQGLDSQVAVKEMLIHADDPAAVAQFRREAQMLHQLQHANLPRVHDFFDENGQSYLVMDYIQGSTLDDVIRFEPAAEEDVRRWAQELCSVLDYLHNHTPPIIFRDLKPSNIMRAEDGTIKLIDFGIAKDLDVDTGLGTRTSVRGAGSPGFAAPEQYGTGTDVRTDIYALGATLYCLLARQVPPDATDLAGGAQVLAPLETLRPDVSLRTVQAIEHMMSLNRNKRPSTIQEAAAELGLGGDTRALPRAEATRQALHGPSVLDTAELASGPPVPETRMPTAPSRGGLASLGAAAAIVLAILGGVGYFASHRALTISVQPVDATVAVDGVQQTARPIRMSGQWWNREVEVTVERVGYAPQEHHIPVSVGATTIALDPVDEQVVVSTSAGTGNLLVDDALVGPISATPTGVAIPAGKHTLKVIPDSPYESPAPVPVEVTPGKNLSPVQFVLRRPAATVTFKLPAGVRIYVNGKPLKGPSPVLNEVRDASLAVHVTGHGYQEFDHTYDVVPGKSQTFTPDLVATAQSPSAAVPVEQPSVVVLAAPSAPKSVDATSSASASPVAVVSSGTTTPPDPGGIIVPGEKVGDISIGAQAQPIIQSLGLQMDPTIPNKYHDAGNLYDITVVDGLIHSVSVGGPRSVNFRTPAGLAFGSSHDDVVQAMGNPTSTSDKEGHPLLLTYRQGPRFIRFFVSKKTGKVFRIGVFITKKALGKMAPCDTETP